MRIIKKILKSFLNFFLFSALVHNCVLIFLAIKKGNIKFLNYFQVLGLTEFWPRIASTRISDWVSAILMIMIIFGFLGFSLRNKISKSL